MSAGRRAGVAPEGPSAPPPGAPAESPFPRRPRLLASAQKDPTPAMTRLLPVLAALLLLASPALADEMWTATGGGMVIYEQDAGDTAIFSFPMGGRSARLYIPGLVAKMDSRGVHEASIEENPARQAPCGLTIRDRDLDRPLCKGGRIEPRERASATPKPGPYDTSAGLLDHTVAAPLELGEERRFSPARAA